MAFYGQEDYQRGNVAYSDLNDQLDVTHYDLDVDLRDNKKVGALAGPRAGASQVCEPACGVVQHWRIRWASMKVSDSRNSCDCKRPEWATASSRSPRKIGKAGSPFSCPPIPPSGSKLDFAFLLEGDFMQDPDIECDCHYPRSTTSWYPRHGYLDRATFDLTFRHNKKLKIASVGKRLSEEPDA